MYLYICVQYHVACFDEEVRASHCTLGELQQSIVPPSWIVKLPPMVVRREQKGRAGGGVCYEEGYAGEVYREECAGGGVRWGRGVVEEGCAVGGMC